MIEIEIKAKADHAALRNKLKQEGAALERLTRTCQRVRARTHREPGADHAPDGSDANSVG